MGEEVVVATGTEDASNDKKPVTTLIYLFRAIGSLSLSSILSTTNLLLATTGKGAIGGSRAEENSSLVAARPANNEAFQNSNRFCYRLRARGVLKRCHEKEKHKGMRGVYAL